MGWSPIYIKNLIHLSFEIENQDDSKKLSVLDNYLSIIEKKIANKELTQRERIACMRILDKNKDTIDHLTKKELIQRIDKLSHLIKANAPAEAGIAEIIRPAKTDPFLNLMFFCDIDAFDQNAAISSQISQAISESIPFVASKSLLSGSSVDEEITNPRERIKSEILLKQNDWHIYQKGDLIVFIPKAYPYNVTQLEMNLSVENEIHDVAKIFDGPTCRNLIEDFIGLFQSTSKVKKNLYLCGHGNIGYVGGLTMAHYRQLLEYLQNSGCQCLTIDSCYGGSVNALEHYYENTSQAKKNELSFPVMIKSIGSFTTTEDHFSYSKYFDNLNRLFNQKESFTVSDFKKAAQEIFVFTNFFQVKLPYHKDCPGGFRPLVENSNSQAISYVDLRAAEIAKSPQLTINNKKYVELLPSRISIPLNIEGRDNLIIQPYQLTETGSQKKLDIGKEAPILLSMIPGKAHHVMDKIESTGFTLFELFVCNGEVYEDSDSLAAKVFFIGELKTFARNFETYSYERQTYSKVVLDLTHNPMNLYYGEGEPVVYHHCQFDAKNKTLNDRIITETEMAFEVYEAILHSKPNADALRASSGGQEEDALFLDSVMHDVFWKDQSSLPADFKAYLHYLRNVHPDKAKELFKVLSPSSHAWILQRAVIDNDTVLATLLLNSGSFDVNKKDSLGRTLINNVIHNKNIDLLKLLIVKGVDLNATSLPNDFTPLIAARAQNSLEMVNLLLEKKEQINFELKARNGMTALFSQNPEIYLAILQAISSMNLPVKDYINYVSTKGWTTFSVAVNKSNTKMIDELIRIGADPYAGKPPPLAMAVMKQNKEMVEYLLSKDIDPAKEDEVGKSALEIACERGTPEITALLMSKANLVDFPSPSKLWIKAQERPAILDLFLKQEMAIFKKDPESLWILGCHACFSKDMKFLNELRKIDLWMTVRVVQKIIDHNDRDTMRLLLENFEYIDLRNFLLEAYEQKKTDFFELFLEFGADPSHIPYQGKDSVILQMVKAKENENLQKCLKTLLNKALDKPSKIYMVNSTLHQLPPELKTQFLDGFIKQDYLRQAKLTQEGLYETLIDHGAVRLE